MHLSRYLLDGFSSGSTLTLHQISKKRTLVVVSFVLFFKTLFRGHVSTPSTLNDRSRIYCITLNWRPCLNRRAPHYYVDLQAPVSLDIWSVPGDVDVSHMWRWAESVYWSSMKHPPCLHHHRVTVWYIYLSPSPSSHQLLHLVSLWILPSCSARLFSIIRYAENSHF